MRVLSARTYVDEVAVVSLFQVVQHRRVVEVGERGHVLALFELGRIDLLQELLLEGALWGRGRRGLARFSRRIEMHARAVISMLPTARSNLEWIPSAEPTLRT